MTEEIEKSGSITLPVEVTELGSPFTGTIMAVLWGILTALLVVACIFDGLDKGFDRSWWMLVPAMLLGWLCFNALKSALGREFYTVLADEVRARIRVLRAWREWSEPMGNYRGVEISSEHHLVGQGAENGSFTATLVHSRDSSKNVKLDCWAWSRHSTAGREEQEAAAETFAREITEQLNLPGTQG